MTASLGEQFARAVAAKDHGRVRELLHPDLDFRAMTPKRVWEAADTDGVIETLSVWFDEGGTIDGIYALSVDSFADRQRVGYRLRIQNADGNHLVEQQAYLSEQEGRIGWLRIMCSGYRPLD